MDILEVLTVAQAAFRINGNKVIGTNQYPPTGVPNKTLILSHFNNSHPIDIIDEDRVLGKEIRDHICQQMTISKLTNAAVAEFVATVSDTVAKDSVKLSEIGFVAWAPMIYVNMLENDRATINFAHYAGTSKHVGKIKSKIEINFTPITVRYNREYKCFRHTGHDDYGNLIGFLNKDKLQGNITGRVKSHARSAHLSNSSITYINYVKVVK